MEILLELELDVFARLLQVPISTSRVSTDWRPIRKKEKGKRKNDYLFAIRRASLYM
jgi:hypothetical protein